jgi:hypothetical protein
MIGNPMNILKKMHNRVFVDSPLSKNDSYQKISRNTRFNNEILMAKDKMKVNQ